MATIREVAGRARVSPTTVSHYLYSLDDLYGVQGWVQNFLPRPDQTIRVTNMGVTPK